MSPKVFVDLFKDNGIHQTLSTAFDWIDLGKIVFPGAKVFIKPNFTYSYYKEGVTTSPKVMEETVKLLSGFTSNIIIGESNGGSNAWQAEEPIAAHNLPHLSDKYGVKLVNLSKMPSEMAETDIGGKSVRVELPSLLLHEVDVFITMPVPKVHVMTILSLAFKNQWGCIPNVKRLRYHSNFDYTVLAVNKLVKNRIAIFDGTYFLDRTGPMVGDPVPMNMIIAANDPGAGSLVCSEIMGFPPDAIRHQKLAQQIGMMPRDLRSVVLNKELEQFKTHKFKLERSFKNYLALAAFRNGVLSWLVAESALAKPIHQIYYAIFGAPDIAAQW
jgi:uncharacterized protein (DUF362 family)